MKLETFIHLNQTMEAPSDTYIHYRSHETLTLTYALYILI